MTSKVIQDIVASVFSHMTLGRIRETLPSQLIARHNLMPRPQALWTVHCPTNLKELENARFRLKFEELFYIQLASCETGTSTGRKWLA